MVIYVLMKGDERVEVLDGREARRDQLIAAGFNWINPLDSSLTTGEPKTDTMLAVKSVKHGTKAKFGGKLEGGNHG